MGTRGSWQLDQNALRCIKEDNPSQTELQLTRASEAKLISQPNTFLLPSHLTTFYVVKGVCSVRPHFLSSQHLVLICLPDDTTQKTRPSFTRACFSSLVHRLLWRSTLYCSVTWDVVLCRNGLSSIVKVLSKAITINVTHGGDFLVAWCCWR